MSRRFVNIIENSVKSSLFSYEDLKSIFPDKSSFSIQNALSYHVKHKNLKAYKRGIYSLLTRGEKNEFSKFQLANKLYPESYISFESALSYHNLIPEAVYEVSSGFFLKRSKLLKNSMGVFSFSPSPVTPFFLDVQKDEFSKALIANPIRALFDLIYMRRKMYQSIDDLREEFRVDLLELQNFLKTYKASEILKLGQLYKKRTTIDFAMVLVRDLM